MKFLSFPIDLLPVDSLLSSAPHLRTKDFVLRTPGIEFCPSTEFLLYPPWIINISNFIHWKYTLFNVKVSIYMRI